MEITLDLKGRVIKDFQPGKLKTLSPQAFPQLAAYLQTHLGELAQKAEEAARKDLPDLTKLGLEKARETLGREHRRLLALREVGNVSQKELELHADRVERTIQALSNAAVNLDAVRALVLQEPKGAAPA